MVLALSSSPWEDGQRERERESIAPIQPGQAVSYSLYVFFCLSSAGQAAGLGPDPG